MTWLLITILMWLWSALAWPQGLPFPGPGGRSRTGNNVALVGTNFGGAINLPATQSLAFTLPASVTANNTVICGVAIYPGAQTFSSSQLTKTAGTATIGTVALDQRDDAVGGGTGVALYSMRVSGSGTLTLTMTPSAGFTYNMVLGCAEFSGVATSPVIVNANSTGTGTSHSTGSVNTSAGVGVMMYVATEFAGATFTRTYSDVLIVKFDDASNFTGIVQFKIVNSSPNTMTDTTGTDSSAWMISYAVYKST